jgi:cell division protein DivIC
MGDFLYKLVCTLLLVVLVGLAAYIGTTWLRTQREYTAFLERQRAAEARLQVLKAEMEARDAYLREFLDNPQFVERIVRQRLGMVRPNEVIYRFAR